MTFTDENGVEQLREYWHWDAIWAWISELFSGGIADELVTTVLDDIVASMKNDYSGLPYEKRFDLMQHMGFLGATGEYQFLHDPETPDEVDRSVFADGAERPFVDKGTDWHRYAR